MQRTHPFTPCLIPPYVFDHTCTGQAWPCPPHVHISSVPPQNIWEEHWALGPHLYMNLLFVHHASHREGKRLGGGVEERREILPFFAF